MHAHAHAQPLLRVAAATQPSLLAVERDHDASITSLPRSAQTDDRVVRLRLTPRAQPWKAIAEDTQLHGAIDKMGHEVELVASEHEKLETARGRARRERSMRNWTTLGGWVLAYVREVPGASPRAR